MAGYQFKSLQILNRPGLDLLPSADKVPQEGLLLAQNFRTDLQGRLVSRPGKPRKFAIAGPSYAHSAAVAGGIEGTSYVVANAASGATPGAVYANFNASAIVSGLSGGRVGMIWASGWLWILDPVVSGKHNLTSGFHQWNLDPPANACVPSAPGDLGVPGTSVVFHYNHTGTLITPGTGAPYWDSPDPTYIHSLTIGGITYQFAEDGYANGQLAQVIASLASADPACGVTASGYDLSNTAYTVTITARPIAALTAVSGSDGNASVNLANGPVTIAAPSGTYKFYVTFLSADQSTESNPGPASDPLTVYNTPIVLSGIPVSLDSQTGARNIYATGGTLGKAYLVGQINDNVTTTFTWSTTDLTVTENGQVMPTTNDPPPAGASGMVGPQYGRLFAWRGSRLFYTDSEKPQYWPGSGDSQIGNWIDVGLDDEDIVWCSIHQIVTTIYKERSVWQLVGDPETGYLQQVDDSRGLVSPFALTAAGQRDYFVAPNGLCRNDGSSITDVSDPIRPLFTDSIVNAGALTKIGNILPPPAYLVNAHFCYRVALGYAMGKLYLAYSENSSVDVNASVLLVYNEAADRWMYHRDGTGLLGIQGFVFDGLVMTGLTGNGPAAIAIYGPGAIGVSLDDFRGFYTQDEPSTPIECCYQGHFEDCGKPDLQKNWLEVVIDCELAGDTAHVYAAFDTGHTPLAQIGTLTGSGRQQKSFSLGTDGVLAKNISVAIDVNASGQVTIHNVYLYYYEEARLATSASTIPIDLGSGKVKQAKELQLDIDSSGGPVSVNLYSDLPGNQLAVRQTPVVAKSGGRAPLKFPFPVTEGFLWRLALTAQSGPFRLYAARLLMRVIGVYVEAYEAANGFVWDSQEHSFDSGITHIPRGAGIALAALPIKRAREISLEIDTFAGDVTVSLLSDLPGNQQLIRYAHTFNTGSAGRRFVRLPLGTTPPTTGTPGGTAFAGGAPVTIPPAYQGWDIGSSGLPSGQFAFENGSFQYAFLNQDGIGPLGTGDLKIHAMRSADAGLTWAELDAANAPSPDQGACYSVLRDGNTVLVLMLKSAAIDTGFTVKSFSLTTGLWGVATDYALPLPAYLTGNTIFGQVTFLHLMLRSAGSYILYFSGARETFKSRLYYATFDGITWGAAIELPDQAGTMFNSIPSGGCVDSSGVVHFFYATDEPSLGLGLPVYHVGLTGSTFGARHLLTADSANPLAFQGLIAQPILIPGSPERVALAFDVYVGTTAAITLRLFLAPSGASAPAWTTSDITADTALQIYPHMYVEIAQAISLAVSGGRIIAVWGVITPPIAPADQGSSGATGISAWYSAQADAVSLAWGVPAVVSTQPDFGGAHASGSQVFAYPTAAGIGLLTVWATEHYNEVAQFVALTLVTTPPTPGTPGGAPIEGRIFRLQLSGSAKFILYGAALEILPVGVYIEQYESATGAVYDSRELDFGTPAVKEARELELDIETTGTVSIEVLSDVSSGFSGTIATAGRQKVMVPLNINAAGEDFVEGRLLRLVLSGLSAYRLYGARLRVRPFGQYLLAAESSLGAFWDTTDLDLGSQTVKQLREVELDIRAYGVYTVTVYTELPGRQMTARVTSNQGATTGRTMVQIPLPQGAVPDNYIFGRLVRVTITSAASFKLFGARIHARPIGVYVESYEAAAGATWDSTPNDLGSPLDKLFDQVRFEMDSDASVQCAVFTDLPGETFAQRTSGSLTSGATSRHWATMPLPAGSDNAPWSVEGRSIRTILTSGAGFRLYKAQVRSARVGRYLAASVGDAFSTLEFDWRSERVKSIRRVEIDLRADGPVTLAMLTNSIGPMAREWATTVTTPNGRQTLSLAVPPGVRGRLIRVAVSSLAAARVFNVRLWVRLLNDDHASWAWEAFPTEESEILPTWSDLPLPETPAQFTWADLPVVATAPEWAWGEIPVAPTPAAWHFAELLNVEKTSDTFEWVDVPFEITGN